MSSAKRTTFASVIALATLSWTQSTVAAEPSASPLALDGASITSITSPSSLRLPSASATADARRSPFTSKPLTAEGLAARRGGDGVFNDNQLKGVVADNHASNLTTGMNVISDGTFSGSVGIPTVIQNSGNNVLIQNSTIVNVQLK